MQFILHVSKRAFYRFYTKLYMTNITCISYCVHCTFFSSSHCCWPCSNFSSMFCFSKTAVPFSFNRLPTRSSVSYNNRTQNQIQRSWTDQISTCTSSHMKQTVVHTISLSWRFCFSISTVPISCSRWSEPWALWSFIWSSRISWLNLSLMLCSWRCMADTRERASLSARLDSCSSRFSSDMLSFVCSFSLKSQKKAPKFINI